MSLSRSCFLSLALGLLSTSLPSLVHACAHLILYQQSLHCVSWCLFPLCPHMHTLQPFNPLKREVHIKRETRKFEKRPIPWAPSRTPGSISLLFCHLCPSVPLFLLRARACSLYLSPFLSLLSPCLLHSFSLSLFLYHTLARALCFSCSIFLSLTLTFYLSLLRSLAFFPSISFFTLLLLSLSHSLFSRSLALSLSFFLALFLSLSRLCVRTLSVSLTCVCVRERVLLALSLIKPSPPHPPNVTNVQHAIRYERIKSHS